MPAIKHDKAKQFLEGITTEDSVLVIHHDDLDGYASGLLFYEYCKKKTQKTYNIPFTYGSDETRVIQKIKEYDVVIITDLGPGAIPTILGSLTKKRVLYVDHHVKEIEIPATILEYRTTSLGYIPCSRTAYELCGGKYWLGVAGTLSDMGHKHTINEAFLKAFFTKEQLSQQKFLEDVVFTVNKFLLYCHDKKQKAFIKLHKIQEYTDVKTLKRYTRQVEREIQKHIQGYKTNKEQLGIVNFYEMHTRYPVKSTVATQLSFMHEQDIIVFATIEKDMIKLSGRTQNKQANMIEVLKTGIKGLEHAGCGGHVPAAGGHIMNKDLQTFKENLKSYQY